MPPQQELRGKDSASQEPTADVVDSLLDRMPRAIHRCRHYKEKRVKQEQAELELLKEVSESTQIMRNALRSGKGQHAVLKSIFCDDCVRIACLRAIVESIHFSEKFASDTHVAACLKEIDSVERVLRDLGLEPVLEKRKQDARLDLERTLEGYEAQGVISSPRKASLDVANPQTGEVDTRSIGEDTMEKALSEPMETTKSLPGRPRPPPLDIESKRSGLLNQSIHSLDGSDAKAQARDKKSFWADIFGEVFRCCGVRPPPGKE
mmetsp:Transcript_58674/g.136956  ORF Transcript_58674/g.136956 Transcript_58674/m.136956 type:complete len:263 (-) Transcript_58674:58-846(-)